MSFKEIFKYKKYKLENETLKNELERGELNRRADIEKFNVFSLKFKFLYLINKKLIKEYKNYINQLESSNNKKGTSIKNYKKDNCELKEENERLTSIINEKQNKINQLESSNNKKGTSIKNYKKDNFELKEEKEKLTAIINEKQNKINQLESSNNKKDTSIKNYKKNNFELKEENEKLTSIINEKLSEINQLGNQNKKYVEMLNEEHYKAENIKEYLIKLENDKENLEMDIYNKKVEEENLGRDIENLKEQVVELNDEILYQSFALYQPLYEFSNSREYKNELEFIRCRQKEMLKLNEAAICNTSWSVNGSESQGITMTKNNIKLILRCFNSECDNVIGRVKFNNYESMEKRILNTFNSLNKLNKKNEIVIVDDYLRLKMEELNLVYEYNLIKQEEKEERRRLLEEKREELKLKKEIEEKRRELEKEKNHYDNVMKRIDEQIRFEKSEERLKLLVDKKSDIQKNLGDVNIALREVDYREANYKAGYVYVISNIGAFGQNVYKIGMTRRLEPLDRIDELGGASVPFKFDVHAMIFSDNAPELESAIHRELEDKKINMINGRKEFFKATLEEIEEVVKANFDKTVDFIKTPEAQQYRESLKMKQSMAI